MRDAIALAHKGWRVFPLTPGSKVPRFGMTDWEGRSSAQVSTIMNWWVDGAYNIGVPAGINGLLVLDLDVPKNLAKKDWPTIEQITQHRGIPDPGTLAQRTPSGGIHLIFQMPEGLKLGNSPGRLPEKVDVRGFGGYFVGPGSVTPRGKYEIVRQAEVLPLPEKVIELITAPSRELRPSPPPRGLLRGDLSRYAAAALGAEVRGLERVPEGMRNTMLNKSSFKIGQLVGAGILEFDDAATVLLTTGWRMGLGKAETRMTIMSGLTAGMQNPRQIHAEVAITDGAAPSL